MTSTWDIIAENFGFMLVFGDTMFIQFVFSIPSWLICRQPADTAPTLLDNLSIAVFIATFCRRILYLSCLQQAKARFQSRPCLSHMGPPSQNNWRETAGLWILGVRSAHQLPW
jgi:delta14-sterol reductase